MLDYAWRATAAIENRSRSDLDTDAVLAGALERFVEVIGEAAGRLTASARGAAPEISRHEIIAMRTGCSMVIFG